MKILVTGGAGYIGSVLVNKLIDSRHQVKVIDDLSNGFKQNIDEKADFIEGSILDNDKLNQALDGVEVVFHLAAKIRVEEGEREPELYKKVNIEGTLNLINKCAEKNIKKLVFASTAAVYGDPEDYPVNEKSRVNPVNVYGATKLEIDQDLEKNATSLGISSICFRFFNIGGALQTKKGNWLKIKHEGATHLIPSILHSSTEKPLLIFGNDWATRDGTAVRDYIHVCDIASALFKSINYLSLPGNVVINLGTAKGYTVLEIINQAEEVLSKNINYKIVGRRDGDSGILVTNNDFAKKYLGWSISKDIQDIISDIKGEYEFNVNI
jgi:UDP-glucose 4-epimerase